MLLLLIGIAPYDRVLGITLSHVNRVTGQLLPPPPSPHTNRRLTLYCRVVGRGRLPAQRPRVLVLVNHLEVCGERRRAGGVAEDGSRVQRARHAWHAWQPVVVVVAVAAGGAVFALVVGCPVARAGAGAVAVVVAVVAAVVVRVRMRRVVVHVHMAVVVRVHGPAAAGADAGSASCGRQRRPAHAHKEDEKRVLRPRRRWQ